MDIDYVLNEGPDKLKGLDIDPKKRLYEGTVDGLGKFISHREEIKT